VYSLPCAYNLLVCDETASISVVNPAQINAYAKAQLRRCKTDRVDANLIRSFAETQDLNDWRPEPTVVLRLCQLIVQRDTCCEDLGCWKNRRHAHGYHPGLDPAVRKSQQAIERALKRQIVNLEKAMSALCKQHEELKRQKDFLCSIPGIGDLSAMRLLAYGKSALTQYSRKELTAQAGLAPRHYQSGTSVRGKSHIAKQGNKRLRTTLFMPTLVGIRYNPMLKRMYQRLLENGKPKMLAIVACMRKLLMIVRAILKKQQNFNPKTA